VRIEERLYGLTCAECGQEDALVLDVCRLVVECRACGARARVEGALEESEADEPGDGRQADGDRCGGERGAA
jgi:hypothetical protein